MDADPVSLDVNVSGIILSAQTGDWHQPSTWIGGVVPTQYTSARIQNGDTVTVTAAASVNDLIIESGAMLNSGSQIFYIYGDYTLNGEHAGSVNDRVQLRGGEAIIDGTGAVSHTGLMYLVSGNKTIAATADLTFESGIRIYNNLIVNNLGTVTLGNAVVGQNASSTWINGENATLETGYYLMNNGILVASAPGNTIRYASTIWTNNIKVPENGTYFNLEITGSTNKTLVGNITVKGDLSISSTLLSNDFNISLEGDWTNTDIFDEGTGQVSFTGNGIQEITNASVETFYDLIVQKESGQLLLNNNITISHDFFLNQGEINNRSNILFLGTSTGNEGTLNYSSGRILGKFRRWLATTGADIIFPTGSTGITRSAVVNFTDLTAGTLTAEFIDGNPGNIGLPVSEGTDTVGNAFTEGYWVIEKGNGLASSNYDLQLEGTGFTSFTFDNNVRIIKRNAGGSPWMLDGTHAVPVGVVAQRVGLNDFSEFALGSSSTCSPPVTSLITGSAGNCANDAAIPYSVINTPGSVYTWTITGGTVASGQGSNAITVNWGATGMAGQVQVIENNGCADGIPVTLDVDIHPLPTGAISGPVNVPAAASGITYSVSGRIGYTYAWTVTGGTLVSGDGTSQITVDWGPEGAGNVQVIATNTACGLSDTPVNLPVTIFGAIRSVQSGNWNDINTWDCGCIPGASDNVVISTGDTVTLDINPTITNLDIESGAVLDNAAQTLIITGNYTVNGTHAGAGNRDWNRLYLDGVGTTIDGTGLISYTARLRMRNGSKTILPTANLTKPQGEVYLDGNVVVTNQGTITIGELLWAANTTSVWINEAGAVLNAGGNTGSVYPIMRLGTLVANADGNIVNHTFGAAQEIQVPSGNTYYHLVLGGGNNKTQTDNLIVLGDLDIASTLVSGDFNLDLAGDWTNSGVYSAGNGIVTLNGTANQAVTNLLGENFNDLTVQKSSGDMIMGGNVNIGGTLNLFRRRCLHAG